MTPPNVLMKARIPAADHAALIEMAKAQHTSIAELGRRALKRALNGEVELTPRLASEKVTTLLVPHEDEQAVRNLAAEVNMSVDEVVRYALNDYIKTVE